MKEYDVYLFDADGTIIDTRELIYQSYVAMGEAIDIALPSRERVAATTGLPVRRQLRELLGWNHDEAFYDRAAQAYQTHMMGIYRDYLRAFPGVAEGLAELAGRGKRLAVVTSRRRRSLEHFLGAVGLNEFFPVKITPEDTDLHKPDPEPALLAMRLLEADPRRTVFVGDAEFDIRCGRAAGTATAFVTWGGMDWRDWPEQPDFVAERFEDLLPDKDR